MYLFARKDKSIPLAVFAAATKDNRELFGEAIAFDNTIMVQRGTLDWTDPEAIVQSLHDRAESFKQGTRMYWFSDALVDPPQPFTLFGEPDKPVAIVAMAGDYAKHDSDNAETSAESIAFEALVKPNAEKIAVAVGSDIPKFIETLSDPGKAKEFLGSLFSEDSSMAILIADGNVLNYEAADAPGKEYPWGFMSADCGYKAVNEGKPTLTLATGGATPKNLTKEMDKATGKVTLVQMSPPKTIKTRKEGIEWYQTRNTAKDKDGKGLVPEQWTANGKRVAVEVNKSLYEKDPDFRSIPTAATSTSVPVVGKAVATPKGSLAAQNGTHVIKYVPSLTVAQKEALMRGWTPYINEANGGNTEALMKAEIALPSLLETIGVPLGDLLKHNPESLRHLAETSPTAVVNALSEALKLLYNHKILSPTAATSPASGGVATLKLSKAG